MKKMILAAVVGAVCLACGGEGGLPDGPPSGGGPGTSGTPDIPGTPEPPRAENSLWPLTQGSSWTYRITNDPLRPGEYTKKVEVLGVMEIPGTHGAKAVAVKSTQPHLQELSWQLVVDGVVLRVREEDYASDGSLLRVTSWDPLTMKALHAVQTSGWTRDETVNESISDGAGNVVDTKVKDFNWSVQEAAVQVTTPKATFENAVKLRRLRADKAEYERVYWLVPGVGKVREEGERTEELIDFTIAPSP